MHVFRNKKRRDSTRESIPFEIKVNNVASTVSLGMQQLGPQDSAMTVYDFPLETLTTGDQAKL